LKLTSSNQTKDTFMHLFNAENKMTKYDTHLDILKEFYEIRLEYYQKRKDYLYNKYKNELDIIKEKIRFINLFITDQLKIVNQSDADIIATLEEHNFIKYIPSGKANKEVESDNDGADGDIIEEIVIDDNTSMKQYNYLIGMPLRTLTKKRMDALKKQCEMVQILFDEINSKTNKQLWLDDLDEFVIKYEEMMEEWQERMQTDNTDKNVGNSKTKGIKKKPAAAIAKTAVAKAKTIKIVQ